jgi:hypothetical protein
MSQLIDKNSSVEREEFFTRTILNTDLKVLEPLWSFDMFSGNLLNIFIEK